MEQKAPNTESTNKDLAMFGAGCFWGVEEVFRHIKGVTKTLVGYSGGPILASSNGPTYHDVCTGTTGHAEVVYIEFDPSLVTYKELLYTLWKCHNPTTLNSQGPDYGTQYRSAIFYYNDQQKQIAEQSIEELESKKVFSNPIVTEVTKATQFYKAEDYHQLYISKKGGSSCH